MQIRSVVRYRFYCPSCGYHGRDFETREEARGASEFHVLYHHDRAPVSAAPSIPGDEQ